MPPRLDRAAAVGVPWPDNSRPRVRAASRPSGDRLADPVACPVCATAVSPSQSECPRCGTAIESSAPRAATSRPEPFVVRPDVLTGPGVTRRRAARPGLAVGAVVLALVVAAVGAYLFVIRHPTHRHRSGHVADHVTDRHRSGQVDGHRPGHGTCHRPGHGTGHDARQDARHDPATTDSRRGRPASGRRRPTGTGAGHRSDRQGCGRRPDPFLHRDQPAAAA
jgi:hypothetical protein